MLLTFSLSFVTLKVVVCMLRTGLVMAFERWREQFEEKCQLRMKAGKVVMRLMVFEG